MLETLERFVGAPLHVHADDFACHRASTSSHRSPASIVGFADQAHFIARTDISPRESTMIEVRYVTERRLRGDQGAKLLRYLLDRGADEFSITVMALHDTPAPFADAFEDELGPYEHPPARRRVVADSAGDDLERLVRLWTFNEQSLERLLSFLDSGVFRWPPGPDGWLEDLTVYRQGELVLGLVSHEQEGVLRLTANELAELAALDITVETTAASIKY